MVVLASSSAVFAVRLQSCSSILAFVVLVDDAAVEQRPLRRCKQLLRKLGVDNLQRSLSKNRHNWMCCTSLFDKLLFAYGHWSTGMRQSTIAKNTLGLDAFSQLPAWHSQKSDKHLSQMLDKPLWLPLWCSERNKRFVRLAHSTTAVVNNRTPSFRKPLGRSTEQNRDELDRRRESLDMMHLPVVAAVERLVVLPCSHKRLLEQKILVEHKRWCQLSMVLEQLVSVPGFVAERSVPQPEQRLEHRNQ